jgi:hypothetical protein
VALKPHPASKAYFFVLALLLVDVLLVDELLVDELLVDELFVPDFARVEEFAPELFEPEPRVEASLLVRLVREVLLVRLPAASAVCLLTILLKLLFSPSLVVSWKRRARLFWSNFSNQSSQVISSKEVSPLNPGKLIRRMPTSVFPPVRRTHDGLPPRSSAHLRISSWFVDVLLLDAISFSLKAHPLLLWMRTYGYESGVRVGVPKLLS